MPSDPRVTPTGVKAPHGARIFSVSWGDGHQCDFPHALLRGYCPCATCQGHSGRIEFREGGNLELVKIERVGNYALGLEWADAHSSGIYSFRYLRRLCELFEERGGSLEGPMPELDKA